jgi:hypothetical protein
MVGGHSATSIMADYFPIMITSSNKGSKYNLPFDLIFVDRAGIKFYPDVVNAVFHGIEIDT